MKSLQLQTIVTLIVLIALPGKSIATNDDDFRECMSNVTSYTQTIATPYDSYTRYTPYGPYEIYVPAEYGDDWWRGLYIFNAWDQKWRRVEYYHYAFLEALVQPELTQALYEEGVLNERLGRYVAEVSGNVAVDTSLVSALLNPSQGIFELEPAEIQSTLDNWQEITNREYFAESLGKLSVALGIVSMGGRFYADATHDMFLHAIANADVLERIDLMDDLVERTFDADSAEYQGYQAARGDAYNYVTADFDALASAVDSLIRNAPQNTVTLTSLTNAVGQQLGLISGELGSAISHVILPYALAVNTGVPLYKDMEALRIRCAYIHLYRVFRDEETRLEEIYLRNKEPLNDSGRIAGLKLMKFAHMRYAVSYTYYQKYDEVIAVLDEPGDIFSIYEWIRDLSDTLTFKWDSIEQCRSDIDGYLDTIIRKSEQIAPYLDSGILAQMPTTLEQISSIVSLNLATISDIVVEDLNYDGRDEVFVLAIAPNPEEESTVLAYEILLSQANERWDFDVQGPGWTEGGFRINSVGDLGNDDRKEIIVEWHAEGFIDIEVLGYVGDNFGPLARHLEDICDVESIEVKNYDNWGRLDIVISKYFTSPLVLHLEGEELVERPRLPSNMGPHLPDGAYNLMLYEHETSGQSYVAATYCTDIVGNYGEESYPHYELLILRRTHEQLLLVLNDKLVMPNVSESDYAFCKMISPVEFANWDSESRSTTDALVISCVFFWGPHCWGPVLRVYELDQDDARIIEWQTGSHVPGTGEYDYMITASGIVIWKDDSPDSAPGNYNVTQEDYRYTHEGMELISKRTTSGILYNWDTFPDEPPFTPSI